ncbi:hypothetical protein BJ741DRAFT_645055 [Chytriomyces cf. hyalinus JEL632]|nr:hypothetical protein BJ741DRAFT_645055 [Chytriomyces cf. hyalinus JEL632]
MMSEGDTTKIVEKMSLMTDKSDYFLALERVLLSLASNHKKNSEKSEIQLYRHVLKAATTKCIEYKTHPADIGITIDGQKWELSPLHRPEGPSTKRLAPKFIHNSVISVRVWSSAKKDFCRINIGVCVWDDTPLFVVSHKWRNSISREGIPNPGYTEAIMLAVEQTAAEYFSDSDQKDYYVWLDYFSTDQHNLSEIREATMKMAWVYSAADFWSNRVWVMQEEALSSNLVFFDRNGQKCPIREEEDGGEWRYIYIGPIGNGFGADGRVSLEGGITGPPSETVIAKNGLGAKREFSDFWPDMMKRNGGFPCDKILVLYIQKLIEAKDVSVTASSMSRRAPGWGCTRAFSDISRIFIPTGVGIESVCIESVCIEYRVTNPLGFIGGHGFPGELPDVSSKIQLDPAMGLVVDGAVVLAKICPEDTDPLSNALAKHTFDDTMYQFKGDDLVVQLFACSGISMWDSQLGNRSKRGISLLELRNKDVQSVLNDLSLYRFNSDACNARHPEQILELGKIMPQIVGKTYLGWGDEVGDLERSTIALLEKRSELFRDVTEALRHSRPERLSIGVRGLCRKILIHTSVITKNDSTASDVGNPVSSYSVPSALTLTEEHSGSPIPVHCHEYIENMTMATLPYLHHFPNSGSSSLIQTLVGALSVACVRRK